MFSSKIECDSILTNWKTLDSHMAASFYLETKYFFN